MDDIPDFEELEWLESHTLDDDQFEYDFALEIQPPSPPSPPSSPEHDSPPKRPTLSLPPKPTSQINHAAQKRVRSDLLCVDGGFDLDNDGFSGKRSRNGVVTGPNLGPELDPVVVIDDASAGGDDADGLLIARSVENNEEGREDHADWTRHSPPRDTAEEMETMQEDMNERILSRYASEIEGDCVPITGLDGERVYAKLCSIEMDEEERRKKSKVREFQGEVVSAIDVFACSNFHCCNHTLTVGLYMTLILILLSKVCF